MGLKNKLTPVNPFAKKYTSAVIAAGGKGVRMSSPDGKTKQFALLRGVPVIVHTLLAFEKAKYVDEIVIVANKEEKDRYPYLINEYGIKKVSMIVEGGETRQRSVLNGFNAINDKAKFVAIHDGARCLVTPDEIDRTIKEAYATGAAFASTKVTDTVKRVSLSNEVQETLDRSSLMLAQTPQVFGCELYRACALTAQKDGFEATDDCSLIEHYGFKVKAVETSQDNFKITLPGDLDRAAYVIDLRKEGANGQMRIGHGYDVHRLKEGRRLILGGVEIPHDKGLDGHSDADVLLHSVMDAVLGALAKGDIGKLFPDTDPAYLGIDSGVLTLKVAELMKNEGYTVENIDVTVIAQKPRLSPYIDAMRENVAALFETDKDNISVKATTEEKLGFTGNEEGIASHAVVLLKKIK